MCSLSIANEKAAEIDPPEPTEIGCTPCKLEKKLKKFEKKKPVNQSNKPNFWGSGTSGVGDRPIRKFKNLKLQIASTP